MNTVDSLKLDKTVLAVAPLTSPSGDKAYWHAKSPYERLQTVEVLRQLNYGRHQSTARLQRALGVEGPVEG
jgi:hypothetical protein